jgi:hypothetical protein
MVTPAGSGFSGARVSERRRPTLGSYGNPMTLPTPA